MRSPTTYISYRILGQNGNLFNCIHFLFCLSLTVNLLIGILFFTQDLTRSSLRNIPEIKAWYPLNSSIYLEWNEVYHKNKKPIWYKLNYDNNKTINYIFSNNYFIDTKKDIKVTITAFWPDNFKLINKKKKNYQ